MLQWPRREDFAYDAFRPMARLRVVAGLDSANHVVGWSNRIVTPGILLQKGYIAPGAVDDQAVEGATAQPYTWGARLVEWVPHPAAVPIGFWRSVGHSFNAWAVESAMDELAVLAGADPVQFRLDHLPAGGRHAAVLQAAATLGGWGSAPAGHAKGVALHESFGSVVGMVAEVSQPSPGQIRVHAVSAAVDCGTAVNPDGVRAQVEGGVVHGLNAALLGKITFNKGVPSPTNYDFFRMMRMRDMPRVDVVIVESGAPLGGVGEPGSPPVAPAVANAWAALTGVRKRSLPMF
jgi:isoquinoline 1-oxidoreductase beta subunit